MEKELRPFARISEYEKDFPLLYKAAVKNLHEKHGSNISPSLISVNDFTWKYTVEGHAFWSCVYSGMLKKAIELIPQYFTITTGDVVPNGFFAKLKTTL